MKAFLFPGQGSQSVGMLSEMAAQFPEILQSFAEASEVLKYDLWQLVHEGPEAQLQQTEFTQPALLTASVALWRLWQAQGGARPDFLAGHSLGEYSALVCAGVLEFTEAVGLVQLRGQLMQKAVPEGQGAMAAIIGLDTEMVTAVCEAASDASHAVVAANLNAVGQIVISGHTVAVDRAMALAKERGAKLVKLLPVSVPSHCFLMKEAAEALKQRFQTLHWNAPQIPVVHNVDVACHDTVDAIRQCLSEQLYSPVRWIETIQFLAQHGVNTVMECGPGTVLSGLVKRIDKSMVSYPLDTPDAFKKALSE